MQSSPSRMSEAVGFGPPAHSIVASMVLMWRKRGLLEATGCSRLFVFEREAFRLDSTCFKFPASAVLTHLGR